MMPEVFMEKRWRQNTYVPRVSLARDIGDLVMGTTLLFVLLTLVIVCLGGF